MATATNPNPVRIVIPPSCASSSGSLITQFPSLADDNEYIPIHSMMDGEVIRAANEDYKNFFYQLSLAPSGHRTARKFTIFSKKLFTSNNIYGSIEWHELRHPTIRRKYLATGGLLLHVEDEPFRVTPLIVLAAKKRYLFNINKDTPDLSQFCLLIDRRLILDGEHFKLYRNLKKYYVNTMEQHIDSMYSYDISRICFRRRELTTPRMNTITETLEYMKGLNSILFK